MKKIYLLLIVFIAVLSQKSYAQFITLNYTENFGNETFFCAGSEYYEIHITPPVGIEVSIIVNSNPDGAIAYWDGDIGGYPNQSGFNIGQTYTYAPSTGTASFEIFGDGTSVTISWGAIQNDLPLDGTVTVTSNSTENDLFVYDSQNKSIGSINSTTSYYDKAMLLLENKNGNNLGLSTNKLSSNTSFGISSSSNMYFTSSSNQYFYSGNQKSMIVTSTRRVGIGNVSSPNSTLHVNSKSGEDGLRVQINGSSKFTVAANGGTSIGYYQNTPPTNGLYVYGQTGIGYSSPGSYKLAVNGSVGVGTTATTNYKLAVNGTTGIANGMSIGSLSTTAPTNGLYVDGAVGIGTTTVSGYKLVVNGTVEAKDFGAAGSKNIIIGDDTYLSDVDRANILGVYGKQNNDRAGIQLGSNTGSYIYGIGGNINIGTTATTDYKLAVNGTTGIANGMSIGSLSTTAPDNGLYVDGAIGIGTTNVGNYELAVNGELIATEVVVKDYSSWPDYVFSKTYELPKLTDVESYIQSNKHLPDVPSATDVEKDGVGLGEMNKILLQKIEELTLYIIKQEKRIAKLEQESQKSK